MAYQRGAVAVVGVGATAQGELPGRTADEIAVEALGLALDDAGLELAIDGLITCRSIGGSGIDTSIGALAGLNPRYSATLDYGTCNFSLHLAAMAIRPGSPRTVAILYGTNQRTARVTLRPSPAGPTSRRAVRLRQHRRAGRAGVPAPASTCTARPRSSSATSPSSSAGMRSSTRWRSSASR